jgi:hypothetical protein
MEGRIRGFEEIRGVRIDGRRKRRSSENVIVVVVI